jgi:hypothetical protein
VFSRIGPTPVAVGLVVLYALVLALSVIRRD